MSKPAHSSPSSPPSPPASPSSPSSPSPSPSSAVGEPEPSGPAVVEPVPGRRPRERGVRTLGAAWDARLGQLRRVFKTVERELGRGAVALLGEGGALEELPGGVPTGCPELDEALGGFGLPRRRVTEVYGLPSSGKTLLALRWLAEAQRQPGVAAFLDVEHALDLRRARALGVDLERLVVAQPDTAEQALYIAEELVRSEAVDLLVVDSVAALVPEGELAGRVGEAPPGLQARLMSQALRRLTVALRKSPTALVLVNQLRQSNFPGAASSTPGGGALPFFAATRLEVGPVVELPGAADDLRSFDVAVRVAKNKLGPLGAELVVRVDEV